MKKRVLWLRYLFLFFAFAGSIAAYAQELTVTGTVTDAADGTTIPGVTVVVKGTTLGTVTDIDGKYSIKVKSGDILAFSYVGYTTQEVTITNQKTVDIILAAGVKSLNEVVVIGYGTVKKGDATGSVAAIDQSDFNKGSIVSPQQQIIGKIPGVQVTTTGGAPGGDAVIRIRGGSSITASNDPLIVIDGVPMDNKATSGSRGTLGMINPEDIDTYTVLKDASATAIYGSRASNGVILITTKKGKVGGEGTKGRSWGLDYSGNVSLYTVPKTISVLDGNEFRSLVNEKFASDSQKDSSARALLGTANTDWQKEIYHNAVATDHNLAFNGGINTNTFSMPYRVSAAYLYQNGILETDNLKRISVGANLSPSFFKNYLKFNINAKYMNEKNRFADNGAIGSAIAFDPSQPVYSGNEAWGGYWAWLQPNGDPVNQATSNPVALLQLRDDESTVNRFLGNLQVDYKLHFLPELRAVLNLGMDNSKSEGTKYVDTTATWVFTDKGINDSYSQSKKNSVLDFYLNYVKDVKSIKSKFDVMAGYSWQHFWYENIDDKGNLIPTDTARHAHIVDKQEYYLVSFYGRLNYTLMNRYLLTFTLRDDGSSKFSPDTRWGLFPSVALAWKINDEAFLRDSKVVSQLKLRLGWGVTGQQDIMDNWYPYIPTFLSSDKWSMYQLGNIWYTTLRAGAYDQNIKWETTTTYNAGFDLGFLGDRIVGSIDYYIRKTQDLILESPVPAGANLSNYIVTNVGDMKNVGWEMAVSGTPILNKDWKWDLGVNATINKNEVTKLSLTGDTSSYILVGGISGGVGNKVQVFRVGDPVYSYFVYHQVYDANGKPIEGLYVDTNNDGIINDADRYACHSANPTVTFGIFTTLKYKMWTLSAAGHAAFGNYVYNNISANRGVYANLYRSEGPYLSNVTSDVFDVNFENQQYLSDYYVQRGDFFKLDYLTLAYDFSKLINKDFKLGVSFTVNNVFTITKYKGLDPELYLGKDNYGIDNNMYPRTRAFVLGVNFTF
jgi:TonB-dependent starch-binding outer membrane protein SusC